MQQDINESIYLNSRKGFNPCFRRLCYATSKKQVWEIRLNKSFNPCFRRLCYATSYTINRCSGLIRVSILVFVDCVMQLEAKYLKRYCVMCFNPCFRRLCYATEIWIYGIWKGFLSFNPCFRRLCYATSYVMHYGFSEVKFQSLFS